MTETLRRWLRGKLPDPVRPADVDPARWQAFLNFHHNGTHKVPRRGATPDHYYSCSWCDPSLRLGEGRDGFGFSAYDDRECEVIRVPADADPANWQAHYWSVQ